MNTNTILGFAARKTALHRALNALAGRCDYAAKKDNVGFNGRDARWGYQMAESDPERWSPRATFLVARMLQTYKVQLLRMGIDVEVLMFADEDDARRMAGEEEAAQRQNGVVRPGPINAEPVQNPRKLEMFSGNRFKVSFPYAAGLVEQIKALPWQMRKFDGATKSWMVTIPESLEGAQAAAAFSSMLMQNQFEMPQGSLEVLLKLIGQGAVIAETRKELAATSTAVDAELVIPSFVGVLEPFQRAGVRYASKAKRTFIADEMGLGKTPQSLAVAELNEAFPVLVIVRPSLVRGWIRQCRQFLPHRALGSIYNQKEILIVTHHELSKYNEWLCKEAKFKTVIVDESHDFKNRKALRSKSAQAVMKAQNPEYRLNLTGTPMPNRHNEYIAQLELLGRLNDLGGWKTFATRYCGMKQTRFGLELDENLNGEELNRKLREICFVRRLKRDVLQELPDKRRDVIELEIENRAEYKKVEGQIRARIEEMQDAAGVRLDEFKRDSSGMSREELVAMFREVNPLLASNDTFMAEMDDKMATGEIVQRIAGALQNKINQIEGAQAIMMMGELKRVAALGKLKQFVEWAVDVMAGGEKLIVFAHSVEIQKLLAQEMPNTIWTRDPKYAVSQEAVDRFKSDASITGIVCSLAGDNAGLNGMEVATNVAFIEYGWVWDTHLQAEDRAHRMGQKNAVNCWYFTGSDTIDETVWELLQEKRAAGEVAVDGRSGGNVAQAAVRAFMRGGK